jgi:hypothetical protein
VAAKAGFVSIGITSDTAKFAVLARTHGTTAVSECAGTDNHGGLRRLKWRACTALEGRIAKARRRDRPRDARPPLSAGHIEVEQDRAPAVLSHHAELARSATHQSPHRGRTGLKVESVLDTRSYRKGIKVSKAQMKCLDINSILNGTTPSDPGRGNRRGYRLSREAAGHLGDSLLEKTNAKVRNQGLK